MLQTPTCSTCRGLDGDNSLVSWQMRAHPKGPIAHRNPQWSTSYVQRCYTHPLNALWRCLHAFAWPPPASAALLSGGRT